MGDEFDTIELSKYLYRTMSNIGGWNDDERGASGTLKWESGQNESERELDGERAL